MVSCAGTSGHVFMWSEISRSSIVKSWLYEVRAKQVRRLWMQRLLRQFRHRQLQRTFCSWLVYIETCRYLHYYAVLYVVFEILESAVDSYT